MLHARQTSWSIAFAYYAILACPVIGFAQNRVDKMYAVGQLGVLEHGEPCEWLTFDDVDYSSERENRVYFATRPGRFKIAAMSKSQVNKVLAMYTITVGPVGPVNPPTPVDPVNPPTPTPPPTPPPIDIPNAMGVGLAVFQIAFAVGDRPACVKAADSLDACAVGLERSNGSEAAINASVKTVNQSISAALAGTKWDAARVAIAAAMTASERNVGGYNYLDRCKMYRECAAGFRAASR